KDRAAVTAPNPASKTPSEPTKAAQKAIPGATLAAAPGRTPAAPRAGSEVMPAATVAVTGAEDNRPGAIRSVTLRVPSHVQRVDFVDEPTRSTVIIDLDEPSMFALEHPAGGRATLHLLHAELPRGLERSLDATEYLGPVKVISTYRDPGTARSVR